MADNRGNVYVDPSGVVVYRASGLGGCIRGLVAARLGYIPQAWPDTTLRAFAEGNLHEDDILRRLDEQHGWQITGQQRRVEKEVAANVIIRGHIDCIATQGSTSRVADAKAMSADTWKSWVRYNFEKFPKYGYQLGFYMIALDLPGMMACKNRNTGELDIALFDVLPVTWEEITERVLTIEHWAARNELPPCDTTFKWGCIWSYLHEDEDQADHVIEQDDTLDALAQTYHDLRTKIGELEQQKDNARTRLLMAMNQRPKVQTSRWSVVHKAVPKRKLDMTALRKAVDVTPFETKENVDQLWVSPINGKEDDVKGT